MKVIEKSVISPFWTSREWESVEIKTEPRFPNNKAYRVGSGKIVSISIYDTVAWLVWLSGSRGHGLRPGQGISKDCRLDP